MSYRLGVTVSCRLGATVSYLLGATLSYRLGAIGPRFCTIFVYPLTFLVGPKVFSGKTSLLNSVQWSGRAHVGQIPETKPYSYQTLLLATAENFGKILSSSERFFRLLRVASDRQEFCSSVS